MEPAGELSRLAQRLSSLLPAASSHHNTVGDRCYLLPGGIEQLENAKGGWKRSVSESYGSDDANIDAEDPPDRCSRSGSLDSAFSSAGDAAPSDGEAVEDVLETLLRRNAIPTLESVDVIDTEGIHVGNVTYILGEVKVREVVQETSITQNVYLSGDNSGAQEELQSDQLCLVSRKEWLAQEPTEPSETLPTPVNLVVISHTASEGATSKTTNMMLVRRIQLMHMEGNDWCDIGYNFLIGMDGNVYEGRGWEAVGAHTYGYNRWSLGVAFIGCFTSQLPSDHAVVALDRLLEAAVSGGHLSPDYRLMAHCQLVATESPGREFYSLIKTWPRWSDKPPTSEQVS